MRIIFMTFLLTATVLIPNSSRANETGYSSGAAFITSDTDRSGGISLEEFSSHIEKAEGKSAQQANAQFGMLDVNKDNKLTLSEMERPPKKLSPLPLNKTVK